MNTTAEPPPGMTASGSVTILSMNLSTNCTNRCFRLAKALSPHFKCKIIGSTFGVGTCWGEGIWPPLAGQSEIGLHPVRGDYFPRYARSVAELLRLIDGDVIIACKPRGPSLGVALLAKLLNGKPVILDIDDDELAQTLPGKAASLLKQLAHPNGYLWTRLVHPLHRFVDAKFVVSENFRLRYGGTVVPHPLGQTELDPNRYDRRTIRAQLGIHDEQVIIGFVGTPSPQKGIDQLAEAVHRIPDRRSTLMIIGVEKDDSYLVDMQRKLGSRLMAFPMQPIARLPEFLAAADIVALPQRATSETWGQMPAKLTDAMAMAKPIIAAARADIPTYLSEGRGITFAPDDVDGLVAAIARLLDRPDDRSAIGDAAREYYLSTLTYEAVAVKMVPIIAALIGRSVR